MPLPLSLSLFTVSISDTIASCIVLHLTCCSCHVTCQVLPMTSGGQNQIAIRFKSRFEAHCDSIQVPKDSIWLLAIGDLIRFAVFGDSIRTKVIWVQMAELPGTVEWSDMPHSIFSKSIASSRVSLYIGHLQRRGQLVPHETGPTRQSSSFLGSTIRRKLPYPTCLAKKISKCPSNIGLGWTLVQCCWSNHKGQA